MGTLVDITNAKYKYHATDIGNFCKFHKMVDTRLLCEMRVNFFTF